MALRFKRTIDVSPHMFATREHAESGLLLYCGAWQAGRLHEALRPSGRSVFEWLLTGPQTPEAKVPLRGEAASVEDAKRQLVEAIRGWAIWAGLRTVEGAAPLAPRWVQEGDT